ncbi:hypothetical protein R1sor_004340 [Riccia sorocarpa]|uniref:Uncharacterized protein n=1 Tax=Riccia sorocarpa TaxID=122646 RepID=A0ABD3HJW9_9MARC
MISVMKTEYCFLRGASSHQGKGTKNLRVPRVGLNFPNFAETYVLISNVRRHLHNRREDVRSFGEGGRGTREFAFDRASTPSEMARSRSRLLSRAAVLSAAFTSIRSRPQFQECLRLIAAKPTSFKGRQALEGCRLIRGIHQHTFPPPISGMPPSDRG